jgi:hypothetical protein
MEQPTGVLSTNPCPLRQGGEPERLWPSLALWGHEPRDGHTQPILIGDHIL